MSTRTPGHWEGERLTLEEDQRVMGFPPTFCFRCSQREALRQLGLAVTPAVAALLAQRGLASLGYQINVSPIDREEHLDEHSRTQ